ncbi:nitroreductase family protein [Metallumcola ferriviriculae]|uniref:Nitroreductase family protein n=1 Tax=Metallumcola ferriviriculae TaxID=3039180 RepID=A0AAU0UNB5_9FIRM|nr:nitroreductase family protein [Desulfitibacteraceae bacterium MK1]
MSKNFIIDEKLCTCCGLCVKECVRHVKIPHQNHVNPQNPACSKCYHCLTVCPNEAIKVKDTDTDIAPDFDNQLLTSIDEDNLMQFFSFRRSHRKYEKKMVDERTLEKLVSAASYIPSGGNSHSYEFTVIKSEQVKKALKKELAAFYARKNTIINNALLRNIAALFTNASTRGFLKDPAYRNRMKDLFNRISTGEDPLFYGAPVIIIIHSKEEVPTPKEDSILAGYNMTLMAQALGLGTCFVTLAQKAINSSSQCKKILNLSKEDNINAVLLLGYPLVNYLRPAPRFRKEIKCL